MSFEISRWAWEQDLPMTRKLILLCLADAADDRGVAYPSASTIAKRCGMSKTSVKTVRRELDALRDAGLITWRGRVRKGTSEQTSHEYTVLYQKVGAENPHLVVEDHHVGADDPTNQSPNQSPNQPPSSLPVASSADDADSSLPLASPHGDAAALKAAALAMYQGGCEDPDAFIDLYETIHPGASTDVGHLIINAWGPEGTTDRIDRLIAKAVGKRDPVTYGVGKWVRKLPGITHGTLGG